MKSRRAHEAPATDGGHSPVQGPRQGPERGNGAAQERLQAALAGRDPQARRGAVPYADRVRAAFGVDVSGVPAFFGATAALRGVGAGAATDGSAFVFGENPSLEDVLHEGAHFAQFLLGSGSTAVDAGGAAEQEVEGAVQVALQGGTPQLARAPDARIHRRVENPREFDRDPTDDWLYVHREVTVADGYSSDPNGVPQEQTSGQVEGVAWEVALLHDEANPLLMSGCPTEDALFTIVGEGEECSGAGQPIMVRHGSVAQPNVTVAPVEEALYIDGAPTMDDVRQQGVGDCYFLAAVSNIVAQDPERILRCVQPAGANVQVNLFGYDGAAWQPQTITTDRTLLHFLNKNSPTVSYDGLVAAGARVAGTPVTSEWYAVVQGDVLQVTRRDRYEMALWAPILEKAYARFAEKTDQYGGGPARDIPTAGRSGYERINGGWEDQVYPIFYGPDHVRNRQESVTYQPGADLVPLNEGAIRNLLRVMDTSNGHFMLSVDLDRDSAVGRLVDLISHIEGLPESRRYPSLLRVMGTVRGLAEAVQNAATPADSTAAMGRLATACVRQARPESWPLLQKPGADPIWSQLNEHINIIAHLGSDASEGQRGTYADHAYAVLGASFIDQSGAAMGLTLSTLSAELGNISGTDSTVRLRNPHHTNEPNLPTSATDGNTEDGLFSMTLDQYLRSFALQQVARVKDTP